MVKNSSKVEKKDSTGTAIRAIQIIFEFIYKMGYEKGALDATQKFIEETKKAFDKEVTK